MKTLKKYKDYIIEKSANSDGDMLSKKSTAKRNDLEILHKQLIDYVKPTNKEAGFEAKINKSSNQITVSDGKNKIVIKDNGKPNNFYKAIVNNKDQGDKNSSENIFAFIDNEFEHTSGIDTEDQKDSNKINNKIVKESIDPYLIELVTKIENYEYEKDYENDELIMYIVETETDKLEFWNSSNKLDFDKEDILDDIAEEILDGALEGSLSDPRTMSEILWEVNEK
jgi:hypothetical protein